MKINSTAELEAIVKMCRKLGVLAIEVDGVKLELAPITPKRKRKHESANDKIDTETEYTDQDLMFWSSQQNG